LLNNSAEHERISKNAQKIIGSDYTLQKMGNEYMILLEELIENK